MQLREILFLLRIFNLFKAFISAFLIFGYAKVYFILEASFVLL